MTTNPILIKIGSSTFSATLQDNQTTKAFKALLPLTVNMIELNGNEKYAELSRNLVTNATNPRSIQNGDLMLYGSNTWRSFTKHFQPLIVIQGLGGLMTLPDLLLHWVRGT